MSRPYTKPSNSVAGLSTTGSPSHLVQTHHRIFGDILQTTDPGPDQKNLVTAAAAFLIEALAPLKWPAAAIWTPPTSPERRRHPSD